MLTFPSMAAVCCEPTAPSGNDGKNGQPGGADTLRAILRGSGGILFSNSPCRSRINASSPCELSVPRKFCTLGGSCKPVRDHVERNHIVHICRQRRNLRPFRTPASIFAGAAQSPWVYRLSPEPHRCSGAIGPYSKRTLDKPG